MIEIGKTCFSTIDTLFHSSIATVRWMIGATFSTTGRAFFVVMPKYLTIIASFDVKSVVNLTAYQANRKFVLIVSETFSKHFNNRSKQLKHRWFRPCRFDTMYFNVLINVVDSRNVLNILVLRDNLINNFFLRILLAIDQQ